MFNKIEQLLRLVVLLIMYATVPLPKAFACAPRFSISESGPTPFWQVFFKQPDIEGNSDASNDATDFDSDSHNKETEWTTRDWIAQHNYSYEEHNVTTIDGYQLQMQRLPREGARPVLLVHGLLTSSLAWVLLGPSNSLAFLLYNRHYDVWLANLRGADPLMELNKTVSDGMEPMPMSMATNANFWNYSFHEQGAYDLPALIDHIREQSSFHQVLLITHSQAFNAFLVLCSLHPIYNERILFTQALAPTVRLRKYMKLSTLDVRRIMKFVKSKKNAQSLELFPTGSLKRTCLKNNSEARATCQRYLELITGQGQYPKSMESLIYSQLLRGGTVKEITHLQQIWKSGDFIAFDYGPIDNLIMYNSVESLSYNLSKVTVPTVLYFGGSDAFATPEGVHSIYAKMLLKTIVGVYRINASKFSHLDFLCSSEAKTLVNEKLIEVMESFMEGKLRYVIE